MAESSRARQLREQLEASGKLTPGTKDTRNLSEQSKQARKKNRRAYIDFQTPLGVGNRGVGLEEGENFEGFRYEDRREPFNIKIQEDIKRKELDPIDPIRKKRKTRKIKKERIVKRKVVKRMIQPRDYVGTITEVLDANRVRVNLSYNDGVNKTKHKGNDQSAEKFTYWRTNYDKSNIERYKTYMVKDNQFYLMVNDKLGADGKSRKVKLKQTLENCEKLDKVYFAEKRLPDYEDTIRLVPFVDRPDDGIFLRIPNLNSSENPINFEGTNFKTHDDLLGSDSSLNFDLEEKLVSGSLLKIQPNIDYQKTSVDLTEDLDDTGFGNFVHFSSAETRIKNFEKKLSLIEDHNANSASLLSISSSADRVSDIEKRRQRVVNSFDPFENYMYFQSSSYVSSSVGQFHDTAWPKTNSSEPYTLAAIGSSQANTWFNNMIASASSYDNRNVNSLRNSLPEHVYSDTKNNVFLEFMDMVGQQFDEIWGYVKGLTDVNKRVEKLSEGISKDVAKAFAQTLGLQLYSGNDLMILPEYLLGKNTDGSDKFESAQEQVTEEIWKRILANLPFFIKAKGTERAVKGLLSCYGIPSSILRVREYGGPDKGTRVSYEIKRKFTRALDFKGSQYVKIPWANVSSHKPETLEFRFRTPYNANQTLIHKDKDWAIELINSASSEYGNVRLSVSASTGVETLDVPKQRFFDDDMWSVMLTRKSQSGADLAADTAAQKITYELHASQYDGTREKINYKTSASININGAVSSSFNTKFTTTGNIALGKSGSGWNEGSFSGSLMEFRLWSEPLSQSIFDNHTRAPKAYNGNTSASAADNLLLRLPLDDNKSYSVAASTTASAVQYLTTYDNFGGVSGSLINGFTGNFFRTLVDKEQLKVPNVGPNRRNATKIRIEDNALATNTVLSPEVRNEVSSQDFAPIDSNRLGVYFSPVDVVNEDIMYSIADLNFDDLIGDPRDEFEYSYRKLAQLQRTYFKKYSKSNNFFDYLRILQFYDKSVFTQVRQLLPARVDATLGTLIEPNILERQKEVIGKKFTFDNKFFENAGDFDSGVLITRVISENSSSIFSTSASSYDTYETTANLAYDSGSHLGFLDRPSLVDNVINKNDQRFGFGLTYATASTAHGTENFTQARIPIISGSRLSEKNQEFEFFYNSAAEAQQGGTAAHSSSFKDSEFESVALTNNLFRSFYQGTLHTRDNAPDGKEPIEITQVAPNVVITQDSDITKLKVK